MKHFLKVQPLTKYLLLLGILGSVVLGESCKKEIPTIEVPDGDFVAVPLFLDFPDSFPDPLLPFDNPLTEAGVALGRKLFYDPILSIDQTISCGSCHKQEFSFSDPVAFSLGVGDQVGERNAMAIVNPAWQTDFFWDGRSPSLKTQAFEPVPNPIEMHLTWNQAVNRLNNHSDYPQLFENVFGSSEIDSVMVAKAIEQFELTFISTNSRFDKWLRFELVLSEAERRGEVIFSSEIGDCFHCHGYPLLTDNLLHNTGLDPVYDDKGLFVLTADPLDAGKFRTPTLRNIALTGPYMHDGRFNTLTEVVEHYSTGLHAHQNIDPLLKNVKDGGVQLSPPEINDLIAFLHTFTDSTFIQNEALSDPN